MNSLILRPQPAEPATTVVRISDLRQWSYCPRVAYFSLVCPVPKVETYKMRLGREKEERLAHLLRRRTLGSFGLEGGEIEHNVELYSSRLGLSGKLDVLIRRGAERFPVEVKFTSGTPQINHRLQLGGYAMLLEDEFGVPVSQGFILRLPDDAITTVSIDVSLRDMVASVATAIRETIVHERCPPAHPLSACCVDCEYRNFCGDTV